MDGDGLRAPVRSLLQSDSGIPKSLCESLACSGSLQLDCLGRGVESRAAGGSLAEEDGGSLKGMLLCADNVCGFAAVNGCVDNLLPRPPSLVAASSGSREQKIGSQNVGLELCCDAGAQDWGHEGSSGLLPELNSHTARPELRQPPSFGPGNNPTSNPPSGPQAWMRNTPIPFDEEELVEDFTNMDNEVIMDDEVAAAFVAHLRVP